MNVTQLEAIGTADRTFDFFSDTFSYPNELHWEYRFDPQTGKTSTRKNDPPPAYALRCFVVVRSARQFFLNAKFAPNKPGVDATGYRALIRSVIAQNPNRQLPAAKRIQIPGFTNLRQFSGAYGDLLRETCGGAWQSYVQRGNWRMVLPFSRRNQIQTAARLQNAVQSGRQPIVHIVTFPRLTINHVLMIFDARQTPEGFEFQCYDPNICEKPLLLKFDRARQTFIFPRTYYFLGGPVNAYEIYCGLLL
ncbi:MAG TPA: hypothetical protein VGN61_05030 [Verrucomicrobiae bacterium]